jgi:Rad3-related DNA helicase
MEKCIYSFNNGAHALLESPTGTGKTNMLLCASLAWLKLARDSAVNQADWIEGREDFNYFKRYEKSVHYVDPSEYIEEWRKL